MVKDIGVGAGLSAGDPARTMDTVETPEFAAAAESCRLKALGAIIPAMGRIRIKKKDRVLPFRETVAYRFIIVAIAAVLFAIALYQFISAWTSDDSTSMIIAGLATAAAAFLGMYNFAQMQNSRIPKQTLQRMKRK